MKKKKGILKKIWQSIEDTFVASVIHGEANGDGFIEDTTSDGGSDDGGSDIDDGGCECE